MILVTPKQEVKRKSKWFCGVKFFALILERFNFKIRFLASGSFVHIRQVHFDFYCFFFQFSIFSIESDFFLNGFPNPFIVHSRPSILFEIIFYFPLVVFCSHAAFWHWFSVFFLFLDLIFFRNGFSHSLIVCYRSSFLFSQWKFFELYVRICPAMFFTTQTIWIVLVRCLFLRSAHAFFGRFTSLRSQIKIWFWWNWNSKGSRKSSRFEAWLSSGYF